MIRYMVLFLFVFLIGFGCGTDNSSSPVVEDHQTLETGVDPTITWTAPTTDCIGALLTGPLTYNVYVISGPGPIPTKAVTSIPCGTLQLADQVALPPVNPAPLTATTYFTLLPAGTYTIAVAARLGAAEGALSAPLTILVVLRPGAPGGVGASSVCFDTDMGKWSVCE